MLVWRELELIRNRLWHRETNQNLWEQIATVFYEQQFV